jgi:TonB family protein
MLGFGCASSSQPQLLGSRAPQSDQHCRVVWAPDPLPPLSAVFDSAGLTSALRREVGVSNGYALISLAADSIGTWNRIRVIESPLAPQVEDKLSETVRQHLRPADSRRQMRLRLEFSDAGKFELGATQTCRSELRNVAEIQALLKAAAGGISARGVVILQVQTLVSGRPGRVVVSQSSGDTALDTEAVRVAARMLFYPALNDGIPVEVWSEVPLVFR